MPFEQIFGLLGVILVVGMNGNLKLVDGGLYSFEVR